MNKIKNAFNRFNNAEDGPAKWEFIVGIVIVFFASIMFCFMKDFRLTVMQGLNFNDCLFHGKIFRYYSEINKLALSGYYGSDWPTTLVASANYSIINYAVLGVLCMPVYLVEHLAHIEVSFLVYEAVIKICYCLMMVYMTKLMYDIALDLRKDKKDAKWAALCFLTSPILIFSSIIISHMDIFSLLFLMLGIKYMIRNDHKRELIFYMIAVAFKPFVVLGIIPMVLMREKRILYLLRDAVVILAGVLVQNVVYHFDPGYGETKKVMSETYNFVGRFFVSGFTFDRNIYQGEASYFIIAFVLICVITYMAKKKNSQLLFALPFAAMVSFVLFVFWHPNWMVLLLPYLAIMMLYTNNMRVMCILEFCFSLFIIIMSAFGWAGFYDIEIIDGGIIPQLLGWKANPKYNIGEVLTRKVSQLPQNFYASFLSAVIIALLFVVIIDLYKNRTDKKKVEVLAWERCAVWLRTFSVILYMLYAIVSCIK